MDIRRITVGFSHGVGFSPLSTLIRWWWGTDYSHVYLKWSTPWGFDEVLEASSAGVSMVEASTWADRQRVTAEYTFTVTRHEFNQVMIQIRSLTGRPYGWRQVLGIAWAELTGRKNNPASDGDRSLVCSEVGYKFLKILGFDLSHLEQDRVSPKDIKDILDSTINSKR